MNDLNIVLANGSIRTGFHTPVGNDWEGCLQWLEDLGNRSGSPIKYLIRLPTTYAPPETTQ